MLHQLGLKLNMVPPRVRFWNLFLISVTDVPGFVRDISVPIVFADDTSILLSHSNPTNFNNNFNTVFKICNDWFKQNLLSLNFTRTQFTNFTTKNNNQI